MRFRWISGESSEQNFFVRHIIGHGLPLICHGWLGQLGGFFGLDEIRLIEMDSYDGLHISRLESSSECDVSYLILEGFARVVCDLGG